MRSVVFRQIAQRTAILRPRPQIGVQLSQLAQPESRAFHLVTGWSRFSSTAILEEDVLKIISPEDAITPRRRFEDLELHPKSLKALRRHGLHTLSEIQDKTFDVIVSGKDVVGRARTGTGKTLSFLLPSLERIVRQQDRLAPGIQMLVLSPTRELAAQLAKEAERLVAQHDETITSQAVFGGASKRDDIDRFHRKLPTILVATPGRLKDHLASTELHGKEPFIDSMQNLQILVLDEMDRLLDMGFRKDIQDILSCLPRQKRQTLLFSATLPDSVRQMVDLATKQEYELVDCIQEEDPASHTNEQTKQSHVVLPTERFWTGSLEYLLELVDKGDSKVMVFFPTTSMVELYAKIFNMRFGRRVLELHGRMQQRERTTISRRFRNSNKSVLFTSDVSARGVDYPDVTHVVQIGASESRDTYVHRLGRTGRAGKKGKGLLILPEVEADFLNALDGLDIPHDPELETQLASAEPSKTLMNELGPMKQKIRTGKDQKLERAVQDTYQGMVSYYFQRCHKSQGPQVVATVNRLIEDMGLKELPEIDIQRARRIGLDTLSGLNIKRNWKDQSWTSGWVDKKKSTGSSHKKNSNRKPDSPRRQGGGGGGGGGSSSIRSAWQSSSTRSAWQKPNADVPNGRQPGSPDGRRNASRFTEAFTKLGWSNAGDESSTSSSHKGHAPRKKGGRFKRWEAPGDFSFRG